MDNPVCRLSWITLSLATFIGVFAMPETCTAQSDTREPFVVVLGIGQDAGIPQAGSFGHPAWFDETKRRRATSLAIIDPETGQYWFLDATPDFREQWRDAYLLAGPEASNVPSGIFLTHAHIGHYTGLMFLGHESAGASGVPVFAYPRMAEFLRTSGPWSQLVTYQNIDLSILDAASKVKLTDELTVESFLVPHRQEFSEVAAFIVNGPAKRILFLPDIDGWEELDSLGVSIEQLIESVDVAYIDATFYANGEIPGRDMSGFPHPFISQSMERFAAMSSELKSRIRFIHLNHTNPVAIPGTDEYNEVIRNGFRVAMRGEEVSLR